MTEKIKTGANKARTIINNFWEFALSVSSLAAAGAILNEVHSHDLNVGGVLFAFFAFCLAIEGVVRFVKFLGKE